MFSDSRIYLSGISLSRYRVASFESHLLCDHAVQLLHFFQVSVKEFQEACLSSGSSLGSQQFHGIQHVVQVFQIQQQVVEPQCRSFAYRRWLCRLEVCESQRRQSLVLFCKISKVRYDVYEFFSYELQTFSHDNQVCVVTYVA